LCVTDDFHTWVLSLPWVVERPYFSEQLGARLFAVACEPLQVRQLWLVTNALNSRVAVVMSDAIAAAYAEAGFGRVLAPMPAAHCLFGVADDVPCIELERVVLDAYGAALAA
jgi:hypothetical protein